MHDGSKWRFKNDENRVRTVAWSARSFHHTDRNTMRTLRPYTASRDAGKAERNKKWSRNGGEGNKGQTMMKKEQNFPARECPRFDHCPVSTIDL